MPVFAEAVPPPTVPRKKGVITEEEAKAVLDFFKKTLLSAGHWGDDSTLSGAFWAGGKGKDVTLGKALELTDSQVGEVFSDR